MLKSVCFFAASCHFHEPVCVCVSVLFAVSQHMCEALFFSLPALDLIYSRILVLAKERKLDFPERKRNKCSIPWQSCFFVANTCMCACVCAGAACSTGGKKCCILCYARIYLANGEREKKEGSEKGELLIFANFPNMSLVPPQHTHTHTKYVNTLVTSIHYRESHFAKVVSLAAGRSGWDVMKEEIHKFCLIPTNQTM